MMAGNVTLRLKKSLKGMTLTVTFNGMAEVDKYIVTFLSISHDVYVGGGSHIFLIRRTKLYIPLGDLEGRKLTEYHRHQ